jgi:hypothetical protein
MLTSRTFSDAPIHVGVHQRRRLHRTLRALAACAITAGLAAAPASAATPQLDQQWSGPWAMAHCVYSHWIAEEQMSSGLTVGVNIAFVPTASGRLSRLRVVIDATRRINGQPSTAGALGVALSSDASDAPGTQLASTTYSAEAIKALASDPDSLAEHHVVDVVFAPRPRVTAGQKYWITLTSVGESDTCFGVVAVPQTANPPQEAFADTFGYTGPRHDPAAVNEMAWKLATFVKPDHE